MRAADKMSFPPPVNLLAITVGVLDCAIIDVAVHPFLPTRPPIHRSPKPVSSGAPRPFIRRDRVPRSVTCGKDLPRPASRAVHPAFPDRTLTRSGPSDWWFRHLVSVLELGPRVNFAQGQRGLDLRQGDDGFQSVVALDGKSALGPPPMHPNKRSIRFDQKKNLERGNGQVGVPLLAQIRAPGRFAHDLDHHHRSILEMIRGRVGRADDHGVRVIESGVVRQLDAHFGVAVERLAGLAAELRSQSDDQINGDGVVPVAGPGHGMHRATDVFVFDRSGLLAGQVIGDSNVIRFGRPMHAETIASPCRSRKWARNGVKRSPENQFQVVDADEGDFGSARLGGEAGKGREHQAPACGGPGA